MRFAGRVVAKDRSGSLMAAKARYKGMDMDSVKYTVDAQWKV